MAFLNREKLMQRQPLRIEKVVVDEQGNYVYVRQMTGRERDSFELSLLRERRDEKGKFDHYDNAVEDFRSKIAVNTVCDEQGNLLFKPEEYKIIGENLTAAQLERIITVAQEINKISKEDQEALIKNLSGGQTASSNSDSVGS